MSAALKELFILISVTIVMIYIFNSKKSDLVSKVYLTAYGDSIKKTVGRDIIEYSLGLENLSIRYHPDEEMDIFAQSNRNKGFSKVRIPVNLLFVKRNNNVYFLILADHNCENLAERMLIDLVSDDRNQ